MQVWAQIVHLENEKKPGVVETFVKNLLYKLLTNDKKKLEFMPGRAGFPCKSALELKLSDHACWPLPVGIAYYLFAERQPIGLQHTTVN